MHKNCTGCGTPIYGFGTVCSACNRPIPIPNPYTKTQCEQITEDTRAIVLMICSDNGACGCTLRRRRTFFLGFAVLFLILGVASLSSSVSSSAEYGDDNSGNLTFTFFVAAAWCVVFLFLCPNGPCGVFSATKDTGRMTADEIGACCGICGGSTEANDGGYASMDNATAPLNPGGSTEANDGGGMVVNGTAPLNPGAGSEVNNGGGMAPTSNGTAPLNLDSAA